MATADDGLIEAVRLARPDSFAIGVQWRPEWFPDDAQGLLLFRDRGGLHALAECARIEPAGAATKWPSRRSVVNVPVPAAYNIRCRAKRLAAAAR